jgi:nuclear pore complex protein Nup98-Nup96
MFGNPSPMFPNQQQGGAKPPGQGGLFGNAQPTSGALFGQPAQTGFGTSTQPTSLFGATAPSNPTFSNPSPFGQPIGQGQQSQLSAPQQQSQFGMQNPPQSTSLFGQAQPFGSTQQNMGQFGGQQQQMQQQPQPSQPFGSFGSSGINPSPFGSTQTNPLTPSFGGTLNPPKPSFPSPFGNNQGTDGGMFTSTTYPQNQGQSTSPFGGISQNPLGGQPIFGSTFSAQQQPQPNSLNTAQIFPNNPMGDNKPFGQPSNGFGQPQFNNQQQTQQTGFGNPSTMTFNNQKGTIPKPFSILTNAKNNKVNTITFMPEYQKKTLALLRLEDYTAYKTNPNSIQNNVAKANLDQYFQKLGQGGQGMGQQFNQGLISPQAKPLNGGLMGSMQPSSMFNPPQNQQFGFPNNQNNPPNPIGGGLFQNQQQPQTAFPSLQQPSQPTTGGLFQNPTQQVNNISLFPNNPLQSQSTNDQSSLFPKTFGGPIQGQGTTTGFLQFPGSQPTTENKPSSLFNPSQPTNTPTSSLFPGQQSTSPFGQPSLNTGIGMGLGLNLRPQGINQPGGQLFPPQNNPPTQQNQIDPLFDPSKSMQPIMNNNNQGLFAQQQQPQQFAQNNGGMINPMGALFGDVQKGPFAIYCIPLDHKTNISKIMGPLHEGLNSGNQVVANLDDELRSLRLGSQRNDYEPALSYNRGYDPSVYDPIEQDYYNTRNYDTYERFREAKNTIKNRMNFDRNIRQKEFVREDRNTKFQKVNNQPNFNITLDIETPDRKLTLSSGKFKPQSMIAEVLKFLVEDKGLLNESDLANITLFAKGKQVFILSKLEEVGLVDNDVLTIKLEEPVEKHQESASNSWMPTLTKEDYKCKPSLKEMSRMTEKEVSTLPHFEISNLSGKIEFEGPIDVRGLNLDKIVYLNERSVEIYPVSDFENNMPPAGTELNRPCVITFFRLIKGPIKDFGAFVTKIERIAKAMNAEVRSIDSNTGAVSIAVESFK